MKKNGLMTRAVRALVCSLLLVVIAAGTSLSQRILLKQGSDFAAKSLSQYVKDIINEKNYQRFGFDSLAEAQRAKLGSPFEEVLIGLKEIKQYQRGATSKDLFVDANALWFPVLVGDKVCTKIEVLERDGRLVAGEFGGIRVARELARVDQDLSRKLDSLKIRPDRRNVLVRVQSLQAIFIYVQSPQGEYLVPAMVQPQRFGLENGKVYEFVEVLSKLKEYAKDIKEDKVM